MRDLARSMIRFSWSMSVLGVRQVTHMIDPRYGWERSTATFDAVSHTAAEHMGETLQGLYKAGDRFQRGLIDTVSRVAGDSWSKPGASLNARWEALDRSTVSQPIGNLADGEGE